MSARLPPLPPLRDWRKGDKTLASHFQEPVAALKAIMQSAAGAPPDVPFPGREMWPGVIVAKGPNGEAAPTGAQYWVQKQTINGDKPTAKLAFSEDKSDQALDSQLSNANNTVKTPNIFSVTNLPEWISSLGTDGSHLLPTGMPVMVFVWWDAGSPNGQGSSSSSSSGDPVLSNKRYVMWQTLGGIVPVNLVQDTGSDGTDADGVATYKYDATDARTGVAIPGGPFSVEWHRAGGHVNVAAHGFGFYDTNGQFHLWLVDETPVDDSCS